jgi:ubiquinone/menaquinone biosynthesis C-methylase UbiE
MTDSMLFEMMQGFVPARAMMSAIQLGVFDALAEQAADAAAVARSCGASERGTRMLLDVMCAMGLLEKHQGCYALTDVAARCLVRSSPEYVGGLAESEHLWQSWGHLTDAIRNGEPVARVDQEEAATQFFPRLVKTLHVRNRPLAVRTAEHLQRVLERDDARVLDVACGSGVWGIAIAEMYPHVRVTAHDFPQMLEGLRAYLDRHQVTDRYDFLPGDLKTVDFGEGGFDAAILGNIVHSEGEASSRDLIARMHRALRPGGEIVIVDMVPDDDRTGPLFPLSFALNMLLHTSEGDTYTMGQYRTWLQAAGFEKVHTVDIGSHSPLVVATRT